MSTRGRLPCCLGTLLAAVAAPAQTTAVANGALAALPAAWWERFPADDLPHQLARLGGAEHTHAAAALAAMGARANRCLFGLALLPMRWFNVVPAFGDFGPRDAWAMPALLARVADGGEDATTLALLARLEATASPAAPLLLQGRSPAAKQLGARLTDAPERQAPPRSIPGPPAVDPALRGDLLAILRTTADEERWWPALQALLGIDGDAAVAAAAELFVHAAGDTPSSMRARELLLALRCHCAAVAMDELDVVLVLPEPLRRRELQLAVLAWCPPLHLAFPQSMRERANARRLLELARGADAGERQLAALSAALHDLTGKQLAPHDHTVVNALARDADARTRAFAAAALRDSYALVDDWFAAPRSAQTATLQMSHQLDAEYLRRMPPERLREALAARPAAPRPARTNEQPSIAQQIVAASERPRSTSIDRTFADELLRAVVARTPDLLVPFATGDAAHRRTIAEVVTFAGLRELPRQLQEAWVDEQELPFERDYEYVPPAVMPVLFDRLSRGDRLEHTIALLHRGNNYADWSDALDRECDSLVAAVTRVPASQLPLLANLLTYGERRRRAAERLLLAPDTPPAFRKSLAHGLVGGADKLPPSSACVLAAMRAGDPELAEYGRWLAGFATDDRETVAAELLARLPRADDKERWGIVQALGRLGVASATDTLREQMHSEVVNVRYSAAIALAGREPPDAAAISMLTAGIASNDAEERKRTWRWISQSPSVAPLFLDAAVTHLTRPGQIDSMRLDFVLQQAVKTRREQVLDALRRLTRHESGEVANLAAQQLAQLTR